MLLQNTFEIGVWEPVICDPFNDENMPPVSLAAGDSLDTVSSHHVFEAFFTDFFVDARPWLEYGYLHILLRIG